MNCELNIHLLRRILPLPLQSQNLLSSPLLLLQPRLRKLVRLVQGNRANEESQHQRERDKCRVEDPHAAQGEGEGLQDGGALRRLQAGDEGFLRARKG